jgi:hypothetical protein
MKIKATSEQIEAIKDALEILGIRFFEERYGNAKKNAQSNLDGRTHFYDDDTLRTFKGRVLESWCEADGLLFCARCSDSGDFHNTFRVRRVVVHDVFGQVVFRPTSDEASESSRDDRKAFRAFEFDIVAHYKEAIARDCREKAKLLDSATQAVELLKGAL